MVNKEKTASRYKQGSLFDYISSPATENLPKDKNLISNPLLSSSSSVIPDIPETSLVDKPLPQNGKRKVDVKELAYGKKIGGSRYDQRHLVQANDIREVMKDMTTAPASKIFNRESLWPEPDWIKLADDGYDRHSLYRINCIRQNISQKLPQIIKNSRTDLEQNLFTYSQMIITLRDACMENLNGFSNKKIEDFLEKKKSEESKIYKYVGTMTFTITDVLSLLEDKEEDSFDFQFKGIFFQTYITATQMYKALFLKSDVKIKMVNNAFKTDESVPFNTIGLIRQENWPYEPAPEWTKSFFVLSMEYRDIKDGELECTQGYSILDKALYEKNNRKTFSSIITDESGSETKFSMELRFSTVEEAESYAKKLHEQRTEKESSTPIKKNEKSKNDKRLGELIRPSVSEPYRNCLNYTVYDITPDELLNILGVRGIEFGQWLNEKERKGNINEAHAAFLDLCAVLKLPVKASSLGGELALAFGSRGIPSAAAHYEPDKKVFNLTRFKGAGSTAHEWMHAVDYLVGKELYQTAILSDSRNSKNDDIKLDGLKMRSFTSEQCEEKLEIELHKALIFASIFLKCGFHRDHAKKITFNRSSNGIRETLENRYDELSKKLKEMIKEYKEVPSNEYAFPLFLNEMNELSDYIHAGTYKTFDQFNSLIPFENNNKKVTVNMERDFYSNISSCQYLCTKMINATEKNPIILPTHFYEDAVKLDKLYGKKVPYWSNEKELFARAGEFYISKLLQKEGLCSQYLVFGATKEEPWRKDNKGNIILKPETKLIDIVKKRELNIEELSLFQQPVSPYPRKEDEDHLFQTMEKVWEKIRPTILEMTKNKFPEDDLISPPLPKPIAEKTKILKQ